MSSMLQTTRLSKVLAGVLVTTYLTQLFVPDTSNYIALVPGRTLPCVWNLLTSGLLSLNPLELIINVAGLLLLARLVEPVYGSKEFLRLILVVDLLIGCVVLAGVYVAFVILSSSGKGGDLLYLQFCGTHGILAALLVAVKQIMPMHELKLFSSFRLQVKYLPSAVLLLVVLVALLVGRSDYLAFYVSGTYLGWLYLRFFQQQPDGTSYGDASDDFKFASFFPDILSAPMDMLAGVCGLITRLRHAPRPEGGAGAKALQAQGTQSALGADAADASRRRERGAKALEERLGLKSGASQTAAPPQPDVEAGTVPAAIQPALQSQ